MTNLCTASDFSCSSIICSYYVGITVVKYKIYVLFTFFLIFLNSCCIADMENIAFQMVFNIISIDIVLSRCFQTFLYV